MAYDRYTGRQLKNGNSAVSWVHNQLKQDNPPPMVHFGSHQLSIEKDKQIIIVESEKTAIIGSILLPELLWLATGGLNMCVKPTDYRHMLNRQLTFVPDAGCRSKWIKVAAQLPNPDLVEVSDIMKTMTTESQRNDGYDIADLLIDLHQKNELYGIHEIGMKQ